MVEPKAVQNRHLMVYMTHCQKNAKQNTLGIMFRMIVKLQAMLSTKAVRRM